MRWSYSWMPAWVAKLGFHRMYQSTTSFESPSSSASDIGAGIAHLRLALSRSRRNPAAALVAPVAAELLEARELLGGEDRAVVADELAVQRARIADADPALHVPLEARLNGDAALPAEVHDGLHHPLRPTRQDLVERLAVHQLLREGRGEAGEPARAVVRRDVHLPARVRSIDEQEFLRGPRAHGRHDARALLRERLDRGDHRRHPAAAADGEDPLPHQAERVPVGPADADAVSRVERREGVGRVSVIADGDALHAS